MHVTLNCMSNPVNVWTTFMSIDIKYETDAYKPASFFYVLHKFLKIYAPRQ